MTTPLLSIRGLRVRFPTPAGPVAPGQYRHALAIIGPVSRVIVDHCSLSWGVDGTFQVYGDKDGKAPVSSPCSGA